MSKGRGLTALLVALAVVLATVPAGALPGMAAGTAAQDGTPSETPTDGSNANLGASVSGFMQASAANTEGEIDDKMFAARFNTSSDQRREALVQSRAKNLDTRLDRLREQRAELLNESDGEPTVAQRAKAARLTARLDALQKSIDTTSAAADRAGVNVERLDELRRNASEMTGPEVAALAQGLAGTERGPPEDRGVGSPGASAGGDGDGSTAADGNKTDGAPSNSGNGSGPSNDGNESEPSNPGNGPSNGGNQGGSSDDPNADDGGNESVAVGETSL